MTFDVVNTKGDGTNCKTVTTKGNVRIDYHRQSTGEINSVYTYNGQTEVTRNDKADSTLKMDNLPYNILLEIVGSDLLLEQKDLDNIDNVANKYKDAFKVTKNLKDGEITLTFKNGDKITIDFNTYEEDIADEIMSNSCTSNTTVLKVKNGNKFENFIIKSENKKLLASVVKISLDNVISAADKQKLISIATKNGNNILEESDLNPNEKIAFAKQMGYNEFFDIKLSKDGKQYEIKVKKTPWYYPNPNACSIKDEFRLKNGVLFKYNKDLMQKRYNNKGDNSNGDSYNHTKFEAGDVIKLPIEEVSFSSGPSGFISRLISVS